MKESGNQRKDGMLQIPGWNAFQFTLMIGRFVCFLANIITIFFAVGKASEFAKWLEYELPEGLTVFNLAPDSIGVRRKLRTTK